MKMKIISYKSIRILLIISLLNLMFSQSKFKFSLPGSNTWPKLEDFELFKATLPDKIFLRGEKGYNPHTHNTRTNLPKPAVIVQPTTRDEVLFAFNFAKTFKMRISIQSTGQHQDVRNIYDNSVHLDMSNMKSKSIDLENKTITVESGNTFGELHQFVNTQSNGKLMILSGSDSGVGPYGWTTGGGHGKFTRMYGLGVDNLISMELLTYDSTVLKLNENDHKELFRSVKGSGGPAFGIGLSMTFKLYDVPNHVTAWGGWYDFSETTAQLYADFMKNAPKEAGAYYKVMNLNISGSFPYVEISAYCFTKEANCEEVLKNLSVNCFKANDDMCKIFSYDKFYDYLTPSGSERGGAAMYLYGSYLDKSNIYEATNKAALFVKNNLNTICSIHGVLGGASENIDPNQEETSVAPAMRKNLASITCLTLLFEDNTLSEQRSRIKKLQDFGDNTLKSYSKFVYWNEPIHDYPQNDWKERYWGSLENYNRMLHQKQKVDPENYFTCYHCIGYDEAVQGKEPVLCPTTSCSCNNNESGVCSVTERLINNSQKLSSNIFGLVLVLFILFL